MNEFFLSKWWELAKFLLNHLLRKFNSLGTGPTNVGTSIELRSRLSKPSSLNHVDDKLAVIAALKKGSSEYKSRILPGAGFVTKGKKKPVMIVTVFT